MSEPAGDRVEITVPADSAYVSTLRICAASLAARCDLTVDDIEDLRLAVDESYALLLACAPGDGAVHTEFTLRPRELRVRSWIRTSGPASVDRHGFAWTVLGALASDVQVSSEPGSLAIALSKRRETDQS